MKMMRFDLSPWWINKFFDLDPDARVVLVKHDIDSGLLQVYVAGQGEEVIEGSPIPIKICTVTEKSAEGHYERTIEFK